MSSSLNYLFSPLFDGEGALQEECFLVRVYLLLGRYFNRHEGGKAPRMYLQIGH